MLRQYHAPRFAGGNNPHRIGTVPIGSIVYLQDGCRPFSFPSITRCVNPWIIESWHNREYCTGAVGAGGHLATVRSLRDGRRKQVADWILRAHDDAGFLA
jgi:hypothetical protein